MKSYKSCKSKTLVPHIFSVFFLCNVLPLLSILCCFSRFCRCQILICIPTCFQIQIYICIHHIYIHICVKLLLLSAYALSWRYEHVHCPPQCAVAQMPANTHKHMHIHLCTTKLGAMWHCPKYE